ncbi:MAG: phosphatase PAP2 family protein [Pyrinomonadaceae bacterium]
MQKITHRLRQSLLVHGLAGFALAAVTLALLGWIVTGPLKQYPASFDTNVRYAMRQIQSPMWTTFFLAITKLGSTVYLMIIGSAVGLVLIVYRRFRSLLILIVAMVGQAALDHGCKLLFARPRPSALINYQSPESYSFPSGHAVASLSLYFAIAWIVSSRLENPSIKVALWVVSVVLVFLIGMSRVYIGVHYPTDVLAGFIAALIWMAGVMSADRKPL